MRESLRKSLAETPGAERYPSGSVVLCNACGLPIAYLECAINVGDGAGRMARAFKPLSAARVMDLAAREDIDAGVRITLRAMGADGIAAHVRRLREFRPGDPMLCPCCGQCFAQVLAVELHEVLDKAYTVELLTISPLGGRQAPVRGKDLRGGKDWVH